MRRPPTTDGRVWIASQDAQSVLDLANAAYNAMQVFLAQGFAATNPDEKRKCINVAIDLMQAVSPPGKQLARMKANVTDVASAGMSFAAPRAVAVAQLTANALSSLRFRLETLADAGAALPPSERASQAASALLRIYRSLADQSDAPPVSEPTPVAESIANAEPATNAAPAEADGPEPGRFILFVQFHDRC